MGPYVIDFGPFFSSVNIYSCKFSYRHYVSCISQILLCGIFVIIHFKTFSISSLISSLTHRFYRSILLNFQIFATKKGILDRTVREVHGDAGIMGVLMDLSGRGSAVTLDSSLRAYLRFVVCGPWRAVMGL